jgi:glucokinase
MAEAPPARHLGLDLGGTYIKWVVAQRVDSEWRALDRGQVPTVAEEDPLAVVERLTGVARQAIEQWPEVATVGIGVPGLYDPESGATRMLPNFPGDWDGVPVAAAIGRALALPTHLINDARAFGLAELRLGAGRGASTMVGITLGTGVGGVICVDGKVVFGHDGTAGELGHQVMAADGLRCTCGGRGCLEAYARADRITALCGTDSVEEAVLRARNGDPRATAGLEDVCRWLGIGVTNMVALLTPDRVVVGGGIAAAGELILERIRREVRERVFTTDVDEVEIVAAELGTWAGAIGAAVHGADAASLG